MSSGGDGVMALFGAPIAHEDHAQRACYASLAVQQALIPYGEELKRQYGIDFRMRIGLNSGPVVVGAIGDDLRMDYTAQGDTVLNLRLNGLFFSDYLGRHSLFSCCLDRAGQPGSAFGD